MGKVCCFAHNLAAAEGDEGEEGEEELEGEEAKGEGKGEGP